MLEISELVRYSQISPKAMSAVLQTEYEFTGPVECRFFNSGLNDIYVVYANYKTYYLRLGLANRYLRNDYEEEISLLLKLQENHIAAAAPVQRKDGSYVWSVQAPEGERFAVLFEEVKKDQEPKNFFALGAMIARMHQVTDKLQPVVSRAKLDRQELVIKPLKLIQPWCKNRKKQYQELVTQANCLYEIVLRNLKEEAPYVGFCHGDLHSGNIFFAHGKPVVFDFDCMGYGYRAYDLCIYAWNESYSNKEYLCSEEWKQILAGYQSIRVLSNQEISLIPAFMALRQVWLMGLHAKVVEMNAGCSWYNEDYFDEQIQLFERYRTMMINQEKADGINELMQKRKKD